MTRRLALSVLLEVEAGRRLDVAWEASGAASVPERGWIRNLLYGTVRLQGRLDHVLARFSSRPPGELDPEVRAVLRMGAYQILEMDAVPAYAAVSESVALVKGGGSRAAAGLVNAVLRRVVRTGAPESSFPPPERDLEDYLTSWGSHPGWLVRRWIRHFGPAGARALVEANNREPHVCLRPVGMAAERASEVLVAAGLCDPPRARDSGAVQGDCGPRPPEAPARPPSAARSGPASGRASWIRLRRGADPGEALAAVPGVIQDPAASLVADFVAPPAGALVADLCAAPGGKALALSAGVRGVVAGDRSLPRLARVVEGAMRLGAPVWAVTADARFPPLRAADVVLLDVPCSGTGTIRRHPDARWRLREDGIREMAALQRSILEGAVPVVPRGGLLVYATCTLEPEENWSQVKRFLARHPDFRVEPANAPDRFLDSRGCLAVHPQESGFDGAFAARLRRT